MHSIRIKITAITIAAILTSILSVILVCSIPVSLETDRSSAERLNILSRNTQLALDSYLKSIEQSVEMAANIASDSLDSIVLVESGVVGASARQHERTPEQIERLDAYLALSCSRIQEAFSSVANHTQGVVTYYYCITPEISQNEHGFFYSRIGKTGFEEQPPLDARQLDPADLGHTTWYYTPIERGRPSWVGPYTAHFLNEVWTLSYLVPIYKSGALIGVLGMDILMETLIAQISPIRVYDSGFAALYDAEGRVLYHPDLETGTMPEVSGLSDAELLFKVRSSGNELIRYTVQGEERQMAFSTLSNGMKLVITAPVREINASSRHLTRVVLLTTAIIVVLFSGILMLVMGSITRPLKTLTAASRRLADGDYDVELSYRGRDEVGVLTQTFTRMRDHLRWYISDLNRRLYTDDLTGLPNMSHFFQLAEEGKTRLREEGKAPVLLFFNLIGLKHYNRQYGFEEGDKLICAVAKILAEHYGETCCGRFGQDHYAVLTIEDGLEETLRAVFLDCAEANGGKSLPVRVGIYPERLGVVDVSSGCDRAKYAADRHRGSYVSAFYYFDEAMLTQIENQRYIINNLDRALREHWVKVYYQPIVRAATGKVCDEEALARWIDPERGMLSPGLFIPILEDARLIYKLDLYMLDQILLKMQEQQSRGLPLVSQSLNLSRQDFDACDIVDEVCRRVDKAGIARDMLSIEITESSVGSDFEFMKQQIERFQGLGFPVWMDDFGSGYSALDVLQDIHFDLIKFDMRFMHRFGESNESKIILTELVRMAIDLGVSTVTEGVETEEQVAFLREVGCTKLQGFYYSRPIPMEEILERCRKGTFIGYEEPDAG